MKIVSSLSLVFEKRENWFILHLYIPHTLYELDSV